MSRRPTTEKRPVNGERVKLATAKRIGGRALVWSACQGTRELDELHRTHFADQADQLLDDLEDFRLQVRLIPADPNHSGTWGDGHMLREAFNHNPSWYRTLYANHNYLKRVRLVRSLTRIREGADRAHRSDFYGSTHDCVARSIILGRLVNGYEPEERRALPISFSPADCIRTDIMGLDPVNPNDPEACVTEAHLPDVIDVEYTELKAPHVCGVEL